MKRSKKYTEKSKSSVKTSLGIVEAVKAVKKNSFSKFAGKIDLHASIRPSTKKSEANALVRINLTLPNSLGKENRVVVFIDETKAAAAKKAGAIEAGEETLIKKIQEGWSDFDIAIASPSMMPKIAALGKVLGPKGLMPNPKMGTVTDNFEQAVEEFKSGKIAAKADDGGSIHLTIATTEMEDEKITQNVEAALNSILEQTGKPTLSVALKSAFLAPTMGPSVKLHLS